MVMQPVALHPVSRSVTVTVYFVVRLGVALGFGQSLQESSTFGDQLKLCFAPFKGATDISTKDP